MRYGGSRQRLTQRVTCGAGATAALLTCVNARGRMSGKLTGGLTARVCMPFPARRPSPGGHPAGAFDSAQEISLVLVPQEGFEPPTPSLRMMCSTD